MSYIKFMESITISSKGQIVIPAFLRKKWQLKTGDTLFVSETSEGILLKTHSVKKTKKVKGLETQPTHNVHIIICLDTRHT